MPVGRYIPSTAGARLGLALLVLLAIGTVAGAVSPDEPARPKATYDAAQLKADTDDALAAGRSRWQITKTTASTGGTVDVYTRLYPKASNDPAFTGICTTTESVAAERVRIVRAGDGSLIKSC